MHGGLRVPCCSATPGRNDVDSLRPCLYDETRLCSLARPSREEKYA